MVTSSDALKNHDLIKRWEGLDLDLLPIDSLDVKILCILRDNSRTSNAEIARILKTSEATIRRRIKGMLDKGVLITEGATNRLEYRLRGKGNA